MNAWKFVFRSIRHFWAIHLSMALAVAITTAVIVGALSVGDSMRGSLKGLVLKRLGPVDYVMTSQSFFHQKTFDSWINKSVVQESFPLSSPAVFFPAGSIEFQPKQDQQSASPSDLSKSLRWTPVSIWGTTKSFWEMDWATESKNRSLKLAASEVVLNQSAAASLGIEESDLGKLVSLRIGKPSDVPAESFISTKDDRVQSIARLKLKRIIPNKGLGKLSLFPTVEDQPIVFVSAESLQRVVPRAVRRSRDSGTLYNAILLAAGNPDGRELGQIIDPKTADQAIQAFQPEIEDAGFRLKDSIVQKSYKDGSPSKKIIQYWNLTSSRMMLDPGQLELASKALSGKKFQNVLTYLANDISISPNQDQVISDKVSFYRVQKSVDSKPEEESSQKNEHSGIPFSMVTASRFEAPLELTDSGRQNLPPLKGNKIWLNRWAAEDLGVKVGHWIRLKYFQPVSVDGDEEEFYADFQLTGIAGLEKPSRQFRRRGRSVIPAVFYNEPFKANDPDLTPVVPGVTDAESISAWDLPFETADQIRPQDDEYWKWYRTTPKAFVSLESGQQLWGSRFGKVTGIRIASDQMTKDEIRRLLRNEIANDPSLAGIQFQAVKRDGLAASSGSTPFDVLFLMLSMFVVLSALILLSLFFRLGLQYRSDQMGLLFALGFNRKQVSSFWLKESLPSILLGSISGVAFGLLYAAAIIHLMRTSWVGAVTSVFLETHWTIVGCGSGLLAGIVISFFVIWFSIWRFSIASTAQLVRGGESTQLQTPTGSLGRSSRLASWHVGALFCLAFVLAVVGIFQAGDAQAGSFLGAGFFSLLACLLAVLLKLRASRSIEMVPKTISQVGKLNLGRNPGRTMTSVSLIGISVFLIISVSAFRLAPSDRGTAGCNSVIRTDIGIQKDLNQLASEIDGQSAEAGKGQLSAGVSSVQFFGFRFHDGQQAGCNNPYRSHLPQVLGVPESFIRRFDEPERKKFAWLTSKSETPEQVANPWHLLSKKDGPQERKEQGGGSDNLDDDSSKIIDVVLDKNTAWYSLKVYLVGTEFEVEFPDAGKRRFRLVGLLDNSLLQGTLLVSESDYKFLFPRDDGRKFFLAWASEKESSVELLRKYALYFKDHGWQARTAEEHLAQFLAVQNTYLNAFQSLGALGLLLGTFGLMIAQYRSLLERTRELAVFLALGFSKKQIRKMMTVETLWLLGIGFGAGLIGSAFCIFPHLLAGTANLPLLEIGSVLVGITLLGVFAGLVLVRVLLSGRLVDLLRTK